MKTDRLLSTMLAEPIAIYYVPGMFGSTLEYIIRRFSTEYNIEQCNVLKNGSMHGFTKECHLSETNDIINFQGHRNILTPTYPHRNQSLSDMVSILNDRLHSKNIYVYANNFRDAEINMLFQFYKISESGIGLGIFFDDLTDNIKNWNLEYNHWSDMQHWELRELFSLFYSDWINEWINSINQINDESLKITNHDILHNTKEITIKLFDYLKLTLTNEHELTEFINEWKSKQLYIQKEYYLLDSIILNTLQNVDYSWKKLSLISEAIIQNRLRIIGYEIKCDGLNDFPTDSKLLYNLLVKC